MLSLEQYKNEFIKRYDLLSYLKYFTYKDFRGLNAYEVKIKVDDNVMFGSYYYYNELNMNRIVVFAHGIGPGHLAYMREIEKIAKEGYTVFAYDMIGTGASTGESIDGLLGSISSLNSALEYLYSKNKDVEISLIGHSLGAFASLNIAKYKPYIKNIVAISGFVSLDMFATMATNPNEIISYECIKNNEFYQTKEEVIKHLEQYPGNLFLIHSKDDQIISPDLGLSFVKSLLKKEIKCLLVNEKNHNPNYSNRAIKYKDDTFAKFAAKQEGLTEKEKIDFFADVDFMRMTEQDKEIWDLIFKFIEK